MCTAVALEAGHKIAANHIDAVAQLREINTKANIILNGLMLEINPPPEAEGKAQPKQPGAKDLREIAIKAMAEIRAQLNLELNIMETLYNVQTIADFQHEVLEEIGRLEPESRNRIIEALKAKKALHGSVQVRP